MPSIAHYNINLYTKTGKVDVYYLKGLSYDAIPEITRLKNAIDKEVNYQINDYLSEKKKELSQKSHWQSFNYSIYNARLTLEKN